MKDLAVIRLESTPVDRKGHRQVFSIGESPITISGVQALVQMVTIGLLSRPGSSALLPSFGVDFRGLLLRAVGGEAEHKANAIMAISVLERQILDMQAGEDMPDDERLASLEVTRIYKDVSRFVHHIRVLSAAGSAATLNTKEVFV